MIFLTIGTHEPFDRLIRAVDQWCARSGRGSDILGQITDRATYQPEHFRAVAALDPQTYRKTCEEASLIISHAGMGSIITAMTYGKPIVVLPRRGHLNETRNDHQHATAERFGGRRGVYVALTEDDLPNVLDEVLANADASPTETTPQDALLSPFADPNLIAALRDFIQQK